MRGYVEILESIEQELPVGVDANHGDFVKYIDARLDAILASGRVTKVTK